MAAQRRSATGNARSSSHASDADSRAKDYGDWQPETYVIDMRALITGGQAVPTSRIRGLAGQAPTNERAGCISVTARCLPLLSHVICHCRSGVGVCLMTHIPVPSVCQNEVYEPAVTRFRDEAGKSLSGTSLHQLVREAHP